MTVWLEVIAPSPLAVLCNCPSPSPLVRPGQHGNLMVKISRPHSLGGVLRPWLLSQMTVLLASSLHGTLVWCGSCMQRI